MSAVTFEPSKLRKGAILVRLNGHKIGHILRERGYYYHPFGTALTGKVFATLEECKRSLMEESP